MNSKQVWFFLSMLCLTTLLTGCRPVQRRAAVEQPSTIQAGQSTVTPADSVEAQIENAMSAAPRDVADNATVLGYPTSEGGDMVVLRAGTNGWTCYPDWPASPGNDPSCLDANFTAWQKALMAGTKPEVNSPAFGYMLQGSSYASNTDPLALVPAPGDEWISVPPHLMILAPGGFDSSKYALEPKQDAPYVKWDGTPYEYLISPIPPITAVQIPDLKDSAAAEVMKAEQELNYAADFLHDSFSIDRMLADNFQSIDSSGQHTKAEAMAGILSGSYQGKIADFTDVTATADGDTVTVHFTVYYTGTWNGDPVERLPADNINTWTKNNGQWQMVKSQVK